MSITMTPIRGMTLILIGFLVAASVYFAPVARAQSIEQLQQQVNQLLATVAALQAQIAGRTPTACTTFTRSLGVGSTGADVLALQRFLNRDADTRLGLSGAGSPGLETQYYGPITANAVSKFQVKYRADVLTPLGLANPTGYFGPSSIAKAHALCQAIPPVTPPPADDDDDDEPLEGGEASLENFSTDDGDDTSLTEGQSNAPVMDVEFDVEDGDVRINRIDVAFDHQTGSDDEPWDVFDEVTIWVGNDQVAEVDASDEDNWSEDDPENGDFKIRLEDADIVVREGETAEFTVAVSVAGSVDDPDAGIEWDIFIPDDGIRAIDSENINHFTGETNEIVSFEIDEEGEGDELTIRSSSEDPDASTLQLDADGVSDFQTIFAFEIDTDNSSDDIEIQQLPITVELSASTYDEIVNDAVLVIDGEEFDDFTVSDGNSDTATLTFEFDNDDLVINSGEAVTVELMLEFEALDDALEGTTIRASVDGADIEAEGADDLEGSQLGGSAMSEIHVLRTGGVTFDLVETEEELQTNTSGTTADDEGVYTIEFDVTAFEQDVYVNESTIRGTANGTAGVNYVIENSSGAVTADGTVSGTVLDSTADTVGGRFHVNEGQTETFTLIVEYDPATSGFYRLQLYSFNHNDTSADPDTYQRVLPESTYQTGQLSI